MYLHLMQEAYANACRSGGIGHTVQIDKARIAHHTMIGVESEEGNDIQHKTCRQSKRHLMEVLDKVHPSILEIIDEQSR